MEFDKIIKLKEAAAVIDSLSSNARDSKITTEIRKLILQHCRGFILKALTDHGKKEVAKNIRSEINNNEKL